MDNSAPPRGRPTLHKKTDDATAILAGDGLLTFAFDIVTRDEIHKDPTVRLLLTRALARASGIGGMVGGQMLDLAGEGRFGDREPVDVARLQQMKTGALLRYGCIARAILAQSSASRPDRTPPWARPPSSPSSGSTAPSSACAICWRAPMPRFRSSAPRATCCAPPRASSPNARTEG